MPGARLGMAALRIWARIRLRDMIVSEAGRTLLLPEEAGLFYPVHASRIQTDHHSAVLGHAEGLRAWGRCRRGRESTAGAAGQPEADLNGRSS